MQRELHYSPSTYGWVTASVVLAFIVGLQISKRKNKNVEEKTARCIILYSLLVTVFAALLLLGTSLAHWNTLLTTLLPLLLFFVGASIIFPIAMQLALQSTPLYPGAKSGLLGVVQMFWWCFLGSNCRFLFTTQFGSAKSYFTHYGCISDDSIWLFLRSKLSIHVNSCKIYNNLLKLIVLPM